MPVCVYIIAHHFICIYSSFGFLFCFSVCYKKCAKIIFFSCLRTSFKAWLTLSLCFRCSRYIQNKFICNVCFFAPFVDIWFLLLIASSLSTISTDYLWPWINFVLNFFFFYFPCFKPSNIHKNLEFCLHRAVKL